MNPTLLAMFDGKICDVCGGQAVVMSRDLVHTGFEYDEEHDALWPTYDVGGTHWACQEHRHEISSKTLDQQGNEIGGAGVWHKATEWREEHDHALHP